MNRKLVSEGEKIDFSNIYKNEKAFLDDITLASKKLKDLQCYRGKVLTDANNLYNLLEDFYDMRKIVEKVCVFASILTSVDTLDNNSKNLFTKASLLDMEVSKDTAFIDDEILKTDWQTIEKYIKQNKSLEKYRFFLDAIWRTKKHTLSEAEEKLLSEYSNLAADAEENYSVLYHGDMDFPIIKDKNGKAYKITNQNYSKLLENEDRNFRKKVYKKYWGTISKFTNSFASILNTKLKYDYRISQIRGFKNPLAKSLFAYNIDEKLIDNLIEVTHENKDFYKKYNNLLRKAYGYRELYAYDVFYNPIKSNKKYSIRDSIEILNDALKVLGKEYIAKLNSLYKRKAVDFHPTKNKRTGAYCTSIYDVGSFVFTNFNEKIDDISVIAHEMGHAVQMLYLIENNHPVNADCQFLIVEAASTLNEILLSDYILKTTDDINTKYVILKSVIDTILGNLMMCMGRFDIQKELYKTIMNGESISATQLAKLSEKAGKTFQYNGMKYIEESNNIWARVSHYYVNYYNYQYAVGITVASIFANKILNNEKNSIETYIEFLKDGGRDYSSNTLKKYNIDLYDKNIYKNVVELLEKYLNEFEKVVDQLGG